MARSQVTPAHAPRRVALRASPLLLGILAGCPNPITPPTPPSAPTEGSVVITEFMIAPTDCSAADGQWIELYNASNAEIDLDELTLSNGADTVSFDSFDLPAGGTVVATSADATPCHGYLPDLRYPALELGGVLKIASEAGLVDAVDTTEWWLPTGRSLGLDPVALTHTSNDFRINWCMGFTPISASDFGSPGDPNPNCPEDVDTGDTDDTDTVGPLTLDELEEGDLILTEVHVDPFACDRDTAQFVEIRNTSGRAVELEGLLLRQGGTTAPIAPAMSLAAGELAFLTIGTQTGTCWIDGALPDGAWGDALTLNASGTLALGRGEPFEALDEVDLSMLSFTRGVSMQLSDSAGTSQANDIADNWCISRDNVVADNPELPDLGTPGRPNRACPQVVVVADPKLGSELVAGDLVITEMMVDPEGCPDFNAQYFEVFNASGEDLDLTGLSIQVQSGRVTELTSSYPVPADSWALAEFQSGAAIATCYTGLLNDFLWTHTRLLNEGSRISLFNDLGVIDEVDLRDFATTPGAALTLDPGSIDAEANDDPYSWCHSERLFTNSFGDFGTPGASNELCLTRLTDAPLAAP